MTHRCSSHPSHSQERSPGPSLLSTGNPLAHWAATRGLLSKSGAAPPSAHCVCCRCSQPPSGGCYYMALWLGYALQLSAWPVPVLGQARVRWWLLCKAVCGDSSARPRSFNFDSSGAHRPANLRHGVHVWRPGRATGRLQESWGKLWRPRGWSAAGGWTLLSRAKGSRAHASPSTAWTVTVGQLSVRSMCV